MNCAPNEYKRALNMLHEKDSYSDRVLGYIATLAADRNERGRMELGETLERLSQGDEVYSTDEIMQEFNELIPGEMTPRPRSDRIGGLEQVEMVMEGLQYVFDSSYLAEFDPSLADIEIQRIDTNDEGDLKHPDWKITGYENRGFLREAMDREFGTHSEDGYIQTSINSVVPEDTRSVSKADGSGTDLSSLDGTERRSFGDEF